MRYGLYLINDNESLNLRDKNSSIHYVFNEISMGGKTRSSFLEVEKLKVLLITNRSIAIEVEENGTKWHAWVGKKLANDHGMRNYCNPRNPEQMFYWFPLSDDP